MKKTAKYYLEGAYKLGKSTLGVDLAEKEEIQRRKDICSTCNYNRGFLFGEGVSITSKCKVCGCYIAAKVRLKDEKCPLGKW